MNKALAIQLIALFLVVQALGLIVANTLIAEEVQATIVTDNPEDVENAIGLIVYILIFTGIFLLVLKFFHGDLFLLVLEGLAILGTGTIVFSALYPDMALTFALMLLIAQNVFRETMWMKNIASTVAVAGVGALIGVSLGVIPILVFVILLSIYDLIAVFWTKHMVSMAKGITKRRLAFTFSIPTKEHEFQLGTGDMVIPLLFAAGTMKAALDAGTALYFVTPLAVLLASLVGLLWTLDFADKKKIPLPALPPQALLMVIVWFVMTAIGF